MRTMTPGAAFAAEVVGTAILLLVIFCSTDERNANRPQILTAATTGERQEVRKVLSAKAILYLQKQIGSIEAGPLTINYVSHTCKCTGVEMDGRKVEPGVSIVVPAIASMFAARYRRKLRSRSDAYGS